MKMYSGKNKMRQLPRFASWWLCPWLYLLQIDVYAYACLCGQKVVNTATRCHGVTITCVVVSSAKGQKLPITAVTAVHRIFLFQPPPVRDSLLLSESWHNHGSKWGKRTTGMNLSLPFPLSPLSPFLSLPLPSLSFPPLPSVPLEVGPLNPAMGSGGAL